MKRDVRFQLGQLGASADEKQFYISEISDLLKSKNEEEFLDVAELKTSACTKAVVEYFEKSIKPTILTCSGRWLIEPFGIYNPYSGVTNNCIESINAVLKRVLKWKEVDADTLLVIVILLAKLL